jgi:hypothetical protein
MGPMSPGCKSHDKVHGLALEPYFTYVGRIKYGHQIFTESLGRSLTVDTVDVLQPWVRHFLTLFV